MTFELQFDDSQIKELLNTVIRNATNAQPALHSIGQLVVAGVQDNFEEGGAYSSPDNLIGGSKKWRPLSEATIKNRNRKSKGPHEILLDSGALRDSINAKVDKDSVVVGTILEYAELQHFGSKKEWKGIGDSAFSAIVGHIASGKIKAKPLKHKRKLLRGYIPARPFMTIHPTTLDEMVEKLANFITGEK